MYYLKNSLANIKRNRSKYIIVGILIAIISLITVISLVINTSANTAIEQQAQKYGSSVTIETNPEYFKQQMQAGQSKEDLSTDTLTATDYQNYADSDYVESTSYTKTIRMTTSQLEQEMMMGGHGIDGGVGGPGAEQTSATVDSSSSSDTSFNIIGVEDVENSSDFADESVVLVDGDYPTKKNQIMISSSTLEDNDLAIGDEVTFKDNNSKKYKFKIVGTFESVTSGDDMMDMTSSQMYTVTDTVDAISSDNVKLEVTYNLADYQDADKFEAEVEEKGLPESMYVNKNEDQLEQVVSPLRNMQSLLTNFLIIVVVLGGATLVFVNLLILKERKYEIGVLRALGQSKARIVGSILTEIAIVAIIALSIGAVIGIASSQTVSDTMLSSISSADDSNVSSPQGGPGGEMQMQKPGAGFGASSQVITELNTVLDVRVLIITLAINIVLIMISALTAISFIVKYQPSQILREA